MSVVIPVFNEEDNLRALTEELLEALPVAAPSYEIIFVDDASTDTSVRVIEELREQHACVSLVRHNRNCGESAAQASGFAVATGDLVVTMDADRQNDPADLPEMIAQMREGVHCVTGVRRRRMDDWVKRCSSRIANRFRAALLGDRVSDAGCTYRAIRRECIRELAVFNGMHRFIPSMLRMQGYTVIEMPVNHRPRAAGESKYGVGNRVWRGIRDCFAMRWYRKRAVYGPRVDDHARGGAG